ncbi:MAG: T9SS type A sorting domain-containing protein [Calditrichaeota bacterium]|nr:T9SS type A sorting domain-containing protein [Calditrichota bacterium]
MKRINLTILTVALFTSVVVAQEQIGRIWESEGNRRPTNANRFILDIQGFRTLAPGGNVPNIIAVELDADRKSRLTIGQGRASQMGTIAVYDVKTGNKIWAAPLDIFQPGQPVFGNIVNNVGFARFGGGGSETVAQTQFTKHVIVEHGWDLDNDSQFAPGEHFISIIDPNTHEEVYRQQGARLLGAINLPDGRAAILGFMMQDGKIIGVGASSANSGSFKSAAPPASPMAIQTVADYRLELKFKAEPGLRLAYDPELINPPGDLDLDGDGNSDIAMIIEDDNDEPQRVVVRNGQTFDVLWQFPFPAEHKENILKGFHGFVDANCDGTNEAIVGDNLAITLDGTVHTIAENLKILDVNDVDGDGCEDIIGLNTVDSTVVIYGVMPTTSVANSDLAKIHFFLFQNYPNPFNPSTTIPYSLQQSGKIEITIFDLLGRAVRSLVQGHKLTGRYSVLWDGRNDAGSLVSSGTYFYRLKAGEAVQTQRMLFLK